MNSESMNVRVVLNETLELLLSNCTNQIAYPSKSVLIAFHIGRVISVLCILFGIVGNSILILTICRSSFIHLPNGIILIFLSTFDIIRLLATCFYYLIQAKFIPLTLQTSAIYVSVYRYSKNLSNWLKVFLVIDRLLTIKHWIKTRYNIHSNNAQIFNRLQQRKLLLLIFLLLCSTLISQHPNFLPQRFITTYIDPNRLLIVNIPNQNFHYGRYPFNGMLFTIITYIIIDDFMPITILIIGNTILLYELRNLPKLTSRKLSESITILFFLTIVSIFILPRSVLIVFNLYSNSQDINSIVLAVVFHSVQGNEKQQQK